MINEDSILFPKQIKIDDYQPPSHSNLVRIMETANLLLGNGGKSSTTSIIMSKALHFMQQEGTVQITGKKILQLGCGAGFMGIYLSCIGANLILTDLPAMKDMIQRNINLNRDILKGSAQFAVLNWKTAKKEQPIKMMKQTEGQTEKQQGVSTSSSDLSQIKGFDQVDLTIVCQCGNLQDFQDQIKWIGKEGMIVGFHNRDYNCKEDYLCGHDLQNYLLQNQYEYEKLENYHPDYNDQRISIYKIWK